VSELDNSPYPECIQGPASETGEGRSQGTLHLSAIYRDMEEQALLRKRLGDITEDELLRKRSGDITEDDLSWYGAGGFLWEHVFSMAHREAIASHALVRPGEWELDGIVGSPDGIDTINWRVIETKFRWMSSNKFDQLEKYFWLELVQVKGYCKMIHTTEAELWVFFCNGDYRPPRPVVRGKLLEFNDQEIEESWRMIVGHAQRRGWL
jgi:hypothetical protein